MIIKIVSMIVSFMVGAALTYIIITVPDVVVYKSIDIPPYTGSPTNRSIPIDWDEEDVVCLAENIYFEARGEPLEGQYAVADVVIYRTMHANFPNTICEVVHQALYYDIDKTRPIMHMCQFSWRCDGLDIIVHDNHAFTKALYIANDILNDPEYPGFIDYALFYHANSVQPEWTESMKQVDKIGNHIFYL